MPIQKLTSDIIAAAIDGFEALKARTDAKIAELRAMLAGGTTTEPATAGEPQKRKRRMSAAARKRIAAAQKKRWAEFHKKAEAGAEPEKTSRCQKSHFQERRS